jgi:S1-C subfamily serine protease
MEATGRTELGGALVAAVAPGSAAESAGILEGDVIVALDDAPVPNATSLRNRIGLTPIGSEVRITLSRDGKTSVVGAKISEATKSAETPASAPPERQR